MSGSERSEVLTCYEGQKNVVFDKHASWKRTATTMFVLRETCCVLRREIIHISKIDVFLESVTIASACNKVLRKRFLKPNTMVLFRRAGTLATTITVTKLS